MAFGLCIALSVMSDLNLYYHHRSTYDAAVSVANGLIMALIFEFLVVKPQRPLFEWVGIVGVDIHPPPLPLRVLYILVGTTLQGALLLGIMALLGRRKSTAIEL